MNLPRLSVVPLSVVFSVGMMTSFPAGACTCIQTATSGAATISGVVGSGSAAISSSLYTGFQSVGSAVDGSVGSQTKTLTDVLEAFTKSIVTEIQRLPAAEQKYEANLDNAHPAHHASNGCSYVDRTGDTIASERLTALQENNLNKASSQYNQMTSSYPEGVNAGDRFMLQTGTMLREHPDVQTSGMDLVANSDRVGALTPEQMQNASTFINLTTNPNPPARAPKPSSPSALKRNVKVDLYNMRMAIPQGVQNQILSYDAPVLSEDQDSWFGEQLLRIDPAAEEAFREGDLKVSKSDMLRMMSMHRVKDAGWVMNLNAKNPKGVMKDLALMKADASVMDYELWVQERNHALLMSQLLAAQMRQKKDDL